ncbi:MAG: hypothetical protein WAW90_01995 [Minisyncoccia bacterium]
MKYVDLKKKLKELRASNPRDAAEYAYALAMLSKQDGDNKQAVSFGREAITLFDKCQMQSTEECTALNVSLGGVSIPDLIHQDVVRNRLKPLVL